MRLEDEVAAEAIKEASRAYVEDVLGKGIASTKKRTRVRDHSEAVRVRPVHLSANLHQIQAETRHVRLCMHGVRDYSDALRVRPLHLIARCARQELRQEHAALHT